MYSSSSYCKDIVCCKVMEKFDTGDEYSDIPNYFFANIHESALHLRTNRALPFFFEDQLQCMLDMTVC